MFVQWRFSTRVAVIAIRIVACAIPCSAAAGQSTPTLCGQQVPPPAQQPPAGAGPVIYYLGLCLSAQGNVSVVEPETYLFHVKLRPSRPSQAQWLPFDDDAYQTIRDDFTRLWTTGFLDDLSIEANDYVFDNGVIGKVITYHLEERARIKRVSYEGTAAINRSQIDEALRQQHSTCGWTRFWIKEPSSGPAKWFVD